MLNQNDPTAVSRRNALKAGLAGIAALGTGLLGTSYAFAEEAADGSQAASQDLTALGNDELLALEAAVRAEKVRRQINTAVVPRGQYVAGVDLAAGAYTVTALKDGDDDGGIVIVYDATKENQLSWASIDEGESVAVTLAEGNLLYLNSGSFALSPFTIDFGNTENASTAASQEPEASSDASPAADDSSVTPEFKEMMDGYEAFMNSYCDFMVKYVDASNSGDTTSLLAMTADYADLVQQELEWIDKINAVDQSDLSAADAAYYVAVTGRVTQKLLETGVSVG